MSYVDFKTGETYETKPESMAQIKGNQLVPKNDPIIVLRGKLDHAQAVVVAVQSWVAVLGQPGAASQPGSQSPQGTQRLLTDLTEILTILRKVMTAEVMKTPCEIPTMLGLSQETLREQSHNTKKYFGVKSMTLPDYSMGPVYAGLNLIRTEVREVELAAVTAFQDPERPDQSQREDIIQVLNRLSSAVYVMMCRYLQGEVYK